MRARARGALALAALVAWGAPTSYAPVLAAEEGAPAAGDATPAASDAAPAVRGGEPADILAVPVHDGTEGARPLREVLDGTPAVVSVWATYCAPCRAEVPVLREAIRRWKEADVRIVALAADVHDPKRMAALREDWGIDYQTYWVSADLEPRLQTLVPAGLPSTFFVKGGQVVRHDRLLTTESLEALAHEHLGLDAPAP